MRLIHQRYPSPCCELLVVVDEQGALRALEFAQHTERLHRLLRVHYGHYALTTGDAPAEMLRALDDYFAGDLAAVDSIVVATGGTPFQRDVWQALREIPPAATKTYGQLARELGRPSASRAVGAANGANPIAIVVPCHRVIGASGKLTGYSGGLSLKEWLLKHERGELSADSLQHTPTGALRLIGPHIGNASSRVLSRQEELFKNSMLASRNPICSRYTFGRLVVAQRLGETSKLYDQMPANSTLLSGREPMSRTRIPLSRQEENARQMKERLEMSTAEIGLSVRTTNCLEERGIFTVRDLLNSTPAQLLGIANFGEKTLDEVYKALEKFGFFRASRSPALAR